MLGIPPCISTQPAEMAAKLGPQDAHRSISGTSNDFSKPLKCDGSSMPALYDEVCLIAAVGRAVNRIS